MCQLLDYAVRLEVARLQDQVLDIVTRIRDGASISACPDKYIPVRTHCKCTRRKPKSTSGVDLLIDYVRSTVPSIIINVRLVDLE